MAQLPRPAAVDFAAAEEDDGAAWADALDVDDSDLRLSPPSSSRPLRPSSTAGPHPDKPSGPSHGQRIPGPASTVQDAMRLRDSGISPVLGRVDTQAADVDFLRNPWLCALQFLVSDARKDRSWERPGIKRIKADQELHRAPLVVGVVTSCKPNGLGDLFVTLKDPTDTIGASVHRKVLSEENAGEDIAVGCCILLHKVAVFRPSHTTCYLNITKGKIGKVVRKDCDPPFKQDISSGTIESLSATWKETQRVAHLGGRPFGTSEGTASIFNKMVSRTKHSQVADLHSEGGTPNVVHGTILGLEERQGGCLPMFERGEAEGSANIMMGRLGREKMMCSPWEMTNADVSCDHERILYSSNSTSAHRSSNSTEGHHQKSFNIPYTCSQPIPGASSVTPGDGACTQASNNEKLRLLFADEPSSKKLKTNTIRPNCYDATMGTSIDTKSKHGSGNNMAEPFHGGQSSTGNPDEHWQSDFCTVNTGTSQPTKETSATAAAAAKNGSLPSHSKGAISVASIAGCTDWTDEQLSELFADY